MRILLHTPLVSLSVKHSSVHSSDEVSSSNKSTSGANMDPSIFLPFESANFREICACLIAQFLWFRFGDGGWWILTPVGEDLFARRFGFLGFLANFLFRRFRSSFFGWPSALKAFFFGATCKSEKQTKSERQKSKFAARNTFRSC